MRKLTATRAIRISHLTIIAFIALSCVRQTENKDQPGTFFKDLKHSYIALMPGGEPEDLSTFLPLKPSVVAWGNDPRSILDQPERIRERTDNYYKLGIRLQAVNVWMLTATGKLLYEKPEYQEAVCFDIEGNPIVPRWLDGDYKGVKDYWGCTNHPLFHSNLIERASAGIAAGANMLHLDDHLGTFAAADHSGGCFCNYCMEGFRDWLENNYTKQELEKKGIMDIGLFDFREKVRASGFTTLISYKQGCSENSIPLLDEFLTFQKDAAANFVRELGLIADSIAGKTIPVGVNAWNLIPTQLATSHHADYFSNEVSHYDAEDLIPPMCYLLGTALGKPVFSTGTGEDWIHINQHPEDTRVQRWIATAYAFGHYFMYAYNQWGFSEETGTQWTRIPISTYEPICRFITENASLFDDYEAVAQVGVLYNNTACRNNDWKVRNVCRELHYANISIGLLVSGDEFLKFRMTQDQMEQYELIIIPGSPDLQGQNYELLEKFREKGRIITWTDIDEVLSRISPLVSLTNGTNVWVLPRKKLGGTDSSVVIHLLNQDYDAEKGSMHIKTGLELLVSKQLTEGILANKVTLYSPGNDPLVLEVNPTDKGVSVNIPSVDLWAILKIESSGS